jgi:AcrR family transcriptional regulator
VAKGLSRESILAAAIELVDAEGIEGLTMRSLGSALGVQAMSLYRYVANKDDLLDAVQEALVAQMHPIDPGLSWWDALEAIARELRTMLARHPRAIPLFVRPAASERAFAALGQVIEILVAAGFDELDALRGVQSLLAFVVGQAMWQFTPEGDRQVDDEFEFGLELMLLGLEAKLAQRGMPSRSKGPRP